MKNKNITILKGEKDKYKNFYFFISFPPARPSKLFVGNFVRGNIHKIDEIGILKNKKSHENLTESSKSEKSVAFFLPNSWHEKVLNI